MPSMLIDVVVATLGAAHALAAYLYFSRERLVLAWPVAWLAATAACIVIARSDPWLGYGLFAGAVTVWTLWWARMRPVAAANWVTDNEHQATGTIIGDELHIRDVRNFQWQDRRPLVARWESRTYDLSRLIGMDLFVCTWGEPYIAHTMVAFDFGDAQTLCFSIETRRETGERWTPLAGFMRSYELVIIAGDERDLVRLRANQRGETVRLYRLASTQQMRRKILARYVAQMNRLAARPMFYNTIFSNCTTEIARIVAAAGQAFPFDWRLLVSGYIVDYLYDQKLLDTSRPLERLKLDADIGARSAIADADPLYARRIREGMPDPGTPEQVRERERMPAG